MFFFLDLFLSPHPGIHLDERLRDSVHRLTYQGKELKPEEKQLILNKDDRTKDSINFGIYRNGPGVDRSETSLQFVEKESDYQKIDQNKLDRIRKGNIYKNFMNNPRDQYKSMYEENFEDVYHKTEKIDAAETKRLMKELRGSHVLFGNDSLVNYDSMFKDNFDKKPIMPPPFITFNKISFKELY